MPAPRSSLRRASRLQKARFVAFIEEKKLDRSQVMHNSCFWEETWKWQQRKIQVPDQLKNTEEKKVNYSNSIL